MELDKQIRLGHLLLVDRKCRVCGEMKNLIDGFYRTRKDRGPVASSYSYECKECTVQRISNSRRGNKHSCDWQYPDW
jgi:hypothetical protein